ncbi:MAG TPA: ImmA/IrrE family metallo-endopeptidase, partial [Solirubrobacteraceae bacterium]|nr:ImmA/IrrE family metallo-endopeptidase [Solirubrobacteraceae bacterium]
MITWADAHERAAARAAEVQGELDFPVDRPVDVFAAVERRGVVLAFRPLGSFSGAYLPGGAPGILLNEAHSRTRQRHTAGHELGHHELGHAIALDADLDSALLDGDGERWPDEEKEAEAFGGWFVMPLQLLRFALETLGISEPSSPYDVYALSSWLGTSYTATARQLAAARLVDHALAEGWARIPPNAVKRALAGELAPDGSGHDVWWLDGRRHAGPVEARPGDRLVLLLNENPSTGFSWEFTECPDAIRLLADSYEQDWEPEPV